MLRRLVETAQIPFVNNTAFMKYEHAIGVIGCQRFLPAHRFASAQGRETQIINAVADEYVEFLHVRMREEVEELRDAKTKEQRKDSPNIKRIRDIESEPCNLLNGSQLFEDKT